MNRPAVIFLMVFPPRTVGALTGTVPGTGTVPQTGGAAREVFGDSPLRGQSLAKAGPEVIHQTVTAEEIIGLQIAVNRWLLRHRIEGPTATMAPDMVKPRIR
jgi:hypothetical protein